MIQFKVDRYENYKYNLEHAPTFARDYVKQELDYIHSFYDGRRKQDYEWFTEVKYLQEFIKFLALQLDMHGYDLFKKEC